MTGPTALRLARYEARRAGVPALVTTPAVLLAGMATVAVTASSGGTYHQVAGTVVEGLLPLAAGLALSSVLGAETALELQLSLPTPYRRTVARRALLVLLACSGLDVMATIVAHSTSLWRSAHGPLTGQLSWLAPTMALSGVAVLLAVVSRNTAFAASVIAGIWGGEEAYRGWFSAHRWAHPLFLFPESRGGVVTAGEWVGNRWALLGIGLVAGTAAWFALANPEGLTGGGREMQ